MSDKEKSGRLEKDAEPIPGQKEEDDDEDKDASLVPSTSGGEIVEAFNSHSVAGGSSSSNVVNNLLVNHQSSNSTNLIFERSSNITIGNTINVGWPNGVVASSTAGPSSALQPVQPTDSTVDRMYKKTPTIKDMMTSTLPLNEKFLDMFSEHFGSRYQAVSVLLGIPDLFFQRMYEDHFGRGTAEVIYQVLYHHFQNNPSIATVGWFTRFLWANGFRETVWTVKEVYKRLRDLDINGENDDDD